MRADRRDGWLAVGLLALVGLGFGAWQFVHSPLPQTPDDQYAEASGVLVDSAPEPQVTPAKQRRVDPSWVAEVAAQAGIPAPALRAYANAQLDEPRGCEVGWTTLAGIGWVESQHGTLGGRRLGEDGRSDSPILGPALDGAGDFAAIPATRETSQWHGDPDWDHAVGPLQFIPSTWERWGMDGDGDGVDDPNDIDDAAHAAAAYLCADGHDLTSGAGWSDALFGYNHAQSYVDAVYAAASAYAERTG